MQAIALCPTKRSANVWALAQQGLILIMPVVIAEQLQLENKVIQDNGKDDQVAVVVTARKCSELRVPFGWCP